MMVRAKMLLCEWWCSLQVTTHHTSWTHGCVSPREKQEFDHPLEFCSLVKSFTQALNLCSSGHAASTSNAMAQLLSSCIPLQRAVLWACYVELWQGRGTGAPAGCVISHGFGIKKASWKITSGRYSLSSWLFPTLHHRVYGTRFLPHCAPLVPQKHENSTSSKGEDHAY